MNDDDWGATQSTYISTLAYHALVEPQDKTKQLNATIRQLENLIQKSCNGWVMFDLREAATTPTSEDVIKVAADTNTRYSMSSHFVCFESAEAATLFKTMHY